jgi:hypothetical protein
MLTTAVTNNNATLTVSGARGAWNDADMLETVTDALILMFLLKSIPNPFQTMPVSVGTAPEVDLKWLTN